MEAGFDPGEDTRDKLTAMMEGGEMIKLLHKINPKYREVIQMRFVDDLSPKEKPRFLAGFSFFEN